MNYWSHAKDYLSLAYVATLVGIMSIIVGGIVGSLQLWYSRQRDAKLDLRDRWEKIHKAMMEFRFRREILSAPREVGLSGSEAALEALHAMHMLRGELDRAPDSPF